MYGGPDPYNASVSLSLPLSLSLSLLDSSFFTSKQECVCCTHVHAKNCTFCIYVRVLVCMCACVLVYSCQHKVCPMTACLAHTHDSQIYTHCACPGEGMGQGNLLDLLSALRLSRQMAQRGRQKSIVKIPLNLCSAIHKEFDAIREERDSVLSNATGNHGFCQSGAIMASRSGLQLGDQAMLDVQDHYMMQGRDAPPIPLETCAGVGSLPQTDLQQELQDFMKPGKAGSNNIEGVSEKNVPTLQEMVGCVEERVITELRSYLSCVCARVAL